VRRFAGALGVALWRQRERAAGAPAVLVGADGHWTTAELLSSACTALARDGCRAIETGAVTSAALAAAAHHLGCDAALWIGNATERPHGMALRLWGRAGRPWSSPGELDRVRDIFEANVGRPKRGGGALERAGADETYLASLRPLFHALRPLRLVLDTSCQPLVCYLRKLTMQAACDVLRPRALPSPGQAVQSSAFVERRLAALGRQVIAEQAHFGVWIDGAAESCRLVDERGAIVASERLSRLLAAYVCHEKSGATLAVEPASSDVLRGALIKLGARVVQGGATREQMCAAIESSGAVLAGGPSGTFWFSAAPPTADALLCVSLVLTILSGSDRPVSEVLDAA
jgi:phosphoglucosamine mutase